MLHDILGPNALARFDRDVLTQPSAKYVVVLIGINDIGAPGAFNRPGEDVTTQQIIQGYRQLIDRAHQRGLRIFAGTLLPVGGSVYDTQANETKRIEVNAWLRSGAGHRMDSMAWSTSTGRSRTPRSQPASCRSTTVGITFTPMTPATS